MALDLLTYTFMVSLICLACIYFVHEFHAREKNKLRIRKDFKKLKKRFHSTYLGPIFFHK